MDGVKSRGIGGHHSHNMGKDEWLTPPEIIKALGYFDLDPCCPPNMPWQTANVMLSNSIAPLTEGMIPVGGLCHIPRNGLITPWNGRVWCNPPYGQETGRWLARCAEHGNATALIFARTETRDWVEYVWKKAHAILFLWGRLHFYHVDGTRAKANAGGPSALIAYDAANAEALMLSGLPGRVVVLTGDGS